MPPSLVSSLSLRIVLPDVSRSSSPCQTLSLSINFLRDKITWVFGQRLEGVVRGYIFTRIENERWGSVISSIVDIDCSTAAIDPDDICDCREKATLKCPSLTTIEKTATRTSSLKPTMRHLLAPTVRDFTIRSSTVRSLPEQPSIAAVGGGAKAGNVFSLFFIAESWEMFSSWRGWSDDGQILIDIKLFPLNVYEVFTAKDKQLRCIIWTALYMYTMS